MRRVGISEAARAEDVEADEHLDVRHGPELAGPNASQDFLRGMVEQVIVVLDQVTADPASPASQPPQPTPPPGDGSLGIGSLKGDPPA